MFARVTRYHADEDAQRLLEGFKGTLGELQVVEGFSHGYFMIDRATGGGISMTIWENEEAMAASTESAEDRRRERTESGGVSVVSVETYEINLLATAPGVVAAGPRAEPVEEPGEDAV